MVDVSICIPTYDRLDYLKQAVTSALIDESVDVEVVVVDNASHVDVSALLASFNDPRLRFYRNAENLGIVGNFNRCLELARGEYFLLLNDDDKLLPGGITLLKSHLERSPQAGIAIGKVLVIDDQDKIIGSQCEGRHGAQLEAGLSFYRRYLTGNYSVQQCATLIRTDLMRQLAPFDAAIPHCTDVDLWLRASLVSDVVTIENCVAQYRMHALSFTGEKANSGARRLSFERLLEKHEKLARQSQKFSEKELQELYIAVRAHFAAALIAKGLDCFKAGDMEEARTNYARGLKLAPGLRQKIYAFLLVIATSLGKDSYGWLSMLKRRLSGTN